MALAVVAVRHHVSGIYMGHQIKDIYGGMMLVHYMYTIYILGYAHGLENQNVEVLLWSTMVNYGQLKW